MAGVRLSEGRVRHRGARESSAERYLSLSQRSRRSRYRCRKSGDFRRETEATSGDPETGRIVIRWNLSVRARVTRGVNVLSR